MIYVTQMMKFNIVTFINPILIPQKQKFYQKTISPYKSNLDIRS